LIISKFSKLPQFIFEVHLLERKAQKSYAEISGTLREACSFLFWT